MIAADSPASPSVSINSGEPGPLLLTEACMHVNANRLLRGIARPTGIIVVAISTILAIWFWQWAGISLIIGFVGSYFLLVGAYLCWYGRFLALSHQRHPLCPCCTSRLWQFCCARCREPVPPLAFWLGGAFLAHCPHCDFRLSARRGKNTLLAWCPVCASVFPNLKEVLEKPTHVAVWITRHAPAPEQIGGWTPVQENPGLFYHSGDRHSASFLLFWELGRSKETLPTHLLPLIQIGFIDDDIREVESDTVKGLFPSQDELTYWSMKPQFRVGD